MCGSICGVWGFARFVGREPGLFRERLPRALGSLTGSGCEPALELLCLPKASSLHPPDRTLLLGPHLSLSLGPQPSEPPAAGPSVWSKEHPLLPGGLLSGPKVGRCQKIARKLLLLLGVSSDAKGMLEVHIPALKRSQVHLSRTP